MEHPKSNIWIKGIEKVIFNIRWLLVLFYFGLVATLAIYGWAYFVEIVEICKTFTTATTEETKLLVLDMIDFVMIANLVKMCITGSYNSFISKSHGYKNENVSSGLLKIKIQTSVIIVCSIHLLKEFISMEHAWLVIEKELCIYAGFLVSAMVLGLLEYLHVKTEVLEHQIKETEHEKTDPPHTH